MNRIRSALGRSDGDELARPVSRLAGWFLALSAGLVGGVVGGDVQAEPIFRIAVAPFAGERAEVDVATALTARLALRHLDRLIAPGEFVAGSDFDPPAAEVRRWAYNSAVDTIVVGRVVPDARSEGAQRVETVVHSGHSGVELSRHDVVVASAADLEQSVEILAVEILDGLGHVDLPAVDASSTASMSSVSANATDNPADRKDRRRGLEGVFSRSSFRSDTPIEIKAEEAEIVSRGEGRNLVFRRNVLVRHDTVTLRSDRLEASYRKGDSEPRELIAEGRVRVEQDDRRAKCDRAIYLRESNQLTCHGRAELVQGCDIVRGESIEFDLVGNQAHVVGAASIVIQPEADAATSSCTVARGQF